MSFPADHRVGYVVREEEPCLRTILASDYIMAVVSARCPEVADLVIPSSVLTSMLELLVEQEARVHELQARVEALDSAGRAGVTPV
jgi:hypothetical protein